MPKTAEDSLLTTPTLGARISHQLDRLGPSFRKIIGNTGWLMFDRVGRMGLGLFVGVWVARYLGPLQFGSLNFAVAFVALFGALTTLGLEMIVVREIVRSPSDAHEVLGTTFALRGAGATAAALIAVGAIRVLQPADHVAFLLVSILSVGIIFQAFDTIDSFFLSQVQSKITVWAKSVVFLLFAGVKILAIKVHAPLWMFAVATAGETVLGAVGLVIGYRLTGGRILAWRARKTRAIHLLKESWPILFSGLAIMVYMRIDTIMLKMMQGDAAAGLYAAATRVSEVWYFIPMAIVSSVSPAIIRAKHRPEVYYGRLRSLFSAVTFLACVIGSGVALASHLIIRTLYSSSYSSAGPVLAVHVWASVFVFLGVAQAPWDISENLLKMSLYRTVAGAIVNVLINLFLIPRYSAMGAAIATVISYAISGVFANAFHPKTRPLFYLQMNSFRPYKFWEKAA
jgi:PST family polysaccharide transporter